MTQQLPKTMSARIRLLLCVLLGLIVGAVVAAVGQAHYAPLAGWDSAAVAYAVSVLATVLRFNQAATKSHALAENPGRAVTDVLLLAASLASLFAVGLLILQASDLQGGEKVINIALGLVSVVVSWGVVHTLFMLRYARYYYGSPEGGIDFGKDKPAYSDFAYLAFTVGMTFQVSDTSVETRAIRATVLKQALLSYIFGAVIIAATINLLAGLSQ